MSETEKKLSLDATLTGAMNAIKENSEATDAVIVLLDRRTGEFQMAGLPTEATRNIEIMEKALSRLKRASGREYRKSSGIIVPSKHSTH